jgi:cell division protein FtsW
MARERIGMAGPVADTPGFASESAEREDFKVPEGVLWLELELWIEVLLLIGVGLVMVYSASSIMALRKFADPSHYLKRQIGCIILGTCTILVVSRIPYRKYLDYILWIYLLTLLALTLVLIPGLGSEINGARRWFNFRVLLVQPAEFAKVVWIIFLSVFLLKNLDKIKRFTIGFLPPIILVGIMSGLLLKEPDFGTTFMLGSLTVFMLMLAGVPFSHLVSLIPCAGLVFYRFVYHVPYRWERITAFLNPWTDPLDSGYQLIQAWIAVGSGGILGKGLGLGQQKLFYLPESFTDFILAVIGEELGFVGIVGVCVLFLFLFQTGIRISRAAPDYLGSLMAFGLTLLLSMQALMNIGVVLGLFPTKGMPLPFISYGGSAFMANCVAVGVLVNIARASRNQVIEDV